MLLKKSFASIQYCWLPIGSAVKNPLAMREMWVRFLCGPWRRACNPPGSLPGKIHGQGSLVGYSSWSRKELNMTEALEHYTVETDNHHVAQMGFYITKTYTHINHVTEIILSSFICYVCSIFERSFKHLPAAVIHLITVKCHLCVRQSGKVP